MTGQPVDVVRRGASITLKLIGAVVLGWFCIVAIAVAINLGVTTVTDHHNGAGAVFFVLPLIVLAVPIILFTRHRQKKPFPGLVFTLWVIGLVLFSLVGLVLSA